MKICKCFLVIISILFITINGCSSKPSESDGEQFAQNTVRESHSDEVIKIISFRKTNGFNKNSDYYLEFETEIEFLQDGLMYSPFKAKPFRSGAMFSVSQGQIKKYNGFIVFENTENGWRLAIAKFNNY